MEKELYKQKASVQRIQICLLTVVEFHDSVTKDIKTTVSSFPCNIQSSGSVDHRKIPCGKPPKCYMESGNLLRYFCYQFTASCQ